MFVARVTATDRNGGFLAEEIVHDPVPRFFEDKISKAKTRMKDRFKSNFYCFVNNFTEAQVKKFVRENPGVDKIEPQRFRVAT